MQCCVCERQRECRWHLWDLLAESSELVGLKPYRAGCIAQAINVSRNYSVRPNIRAHTSALVTARHTDNSVSLCLTLPHRKERVTTGEWGLLVLIDTVLVTWEKRERFSSVRSFLFYKKTGKHIANIGKKWMQTNSSKKNWRKVSTMKTLT
jgi:hypothetical protein